MGNSVTPTHHATAGHETSINPVGVRLAVQRPGADGGPVSVAEPPAAPTATQRVAVAQDKDQCPACECPVIGWGRDHLSVTAAELDALRPNAITTATIASPARDDADCDLPAT